LIVIRLPRGVDVDIDEFLKKNEALIRRKYRSFLSQIRIITPTTIYLDGTPYHIEIVLDEKAEKVELLDANIVIRGKDERNAQRILKKWLTNQTQELVDDVIELYGEKLGVPDRLSVTDTTRWGYCRNNSVIIINWQLAALPRNLSEYVVVHELVHLTYPNHQKGFYIKLMEVVPDYSQRNKDLRKYLAADKNIELKPEFKT
jgi:predicted metal-dependent hydrolase